MIGNRLKLARSKAGLSLRDLEERINKLVSAQALGKYERNEMMPGSEVLIAIADALDVSESFLLSSTDIHLEEVEFRKQKITNKKDEAQIESLVLDHMERYLEVEGLLGLSSIEWDEPREVFPYPVRNLEDAERSAIDLRNDWDLGADPIPSLAEFLEERGIKIKFLPFPESVSGMTCWIQRKDLKPIPVIVVNANHKGERQRFTMCHELGHIVQKVEKHIDEEKAADRFAGAFLMPHNLLRSEIGVNRRSLSIGELFKLKTILGASVYAIIYRCKDLGIINNSIAGRMFGLFNKKGWNKPPDYEPRPIVLSELVRFNRLCFRALAENIISESKASELLGISVHELNKEMDEPPSGGLTHLA